MKLELEEHQEIGRSMSNVLLATLRPDWVVFLQKRLDWLEEVKLISVEQKGQIITRTLGFEVSTQNKIPSFLKPYSSRVPPIIEWEHRESWNLEKASMEYQVHVPLIPKHWNERIEQTASLSIGSLQTERCIVRSRFKVSVEKLRWSTAVKIAVRPEVTKILRAYLGAMQDASLENR